jgi:tricorn protease
MLLKCRPILCALLFTLTVPTLTAAAQPLGYYRQPAIHGDTIVFVAEGDLWRVAIGGGVASRLTTHGGEEQLPAISPDGKSIAFVGQYEGPSEVYVMPLAGGTPRRLTWDGGKISFVGWTSDGNVLVSTDAYATLPAQQLIILDPDGARTARPRRVPLAQAADGVYAPPGKTLFFRDCRSRGATPSATRVAPRRTFGASPRATRRPSRSPPTMPAPARTPCGGRIASTSPATATAP